MNKKIAIIGANEFQLELILKAKSKGYKTHVFAWQTGDDGELEADFFYPISITDKQAILAQCRIIGIDGICSVASDLATITVDFIADALGLVGNSLECSKKTTNKYLMRQALQKANLPIPYFQLVRDKREVNNGSLILPCIVKPIDRSGSRGITLVSALCELDNAISKSKKCSFVNNILIEEFVSGREFSVESISYLGTHKILQITEKFTSGAPDFIERAHLTPARIRPDEQLLINKVIMEALTCLSITNGAAHSELKLGSNGDIKIIEIGARMGGDFIGSHLVENNTNYDFTNAVIDISVDNEFVLPDLTIIDRAKHLSLVVYYFNKAQFERLTTIENLEGISIKHIHKNESFSGEVTNSAERFGYSFIDVSPEQLHLVLINLGLPNDRIQ